MSNPQTKLIKEIKYFLQNFLKKYLLFLKMSVYRRQYHQRTGIKKNFYFFITINACFFKVDLQWNTGFVQSLEFLKKSWNLPSNFPDQEKVWKIAIKSEKNGKKSWVFWSLNKCNTSDNNIHEKTTQFLLAEKVVQFFCSTSANL